MYVRGSTAHPVASKADLIKFHFYACYKTAALLTQIHTKKSLNMSTFKHKESPSCLWVSRILATNILFSSTFRSSSESRYFLSRCCIFFALCSAYLSRQRCCRCCAFVSYYYIFIVIIIFWLSAIVAYGKL